MKAAIEAFRVDVDPANPGEFLACCGLLELAHRIGGHAEGWFSDGGFHVAVGLDAPEEARSALGLVEALIASSAEQVLRWPPPPEAPDAEEVGAPVDVKPLIAPLRVSLGRDRPPVFLHAWMRVRVEKDEVVATSNPPWNFWSGQQTSLRIWTALRAALADQLPSLREARPEALFAARVALSGRFGFDPRAAWNALDAGFSPDARGIGVASSPAVEMLAAVGLQRCRPGEGSSIAYSTWAVPCGPAVVPAAVRGALSAASSTRRYRGRVVSRGSYAALAYATLDKGAHP